MDLIDKIKFFCDEKVIVYGFADVASYKELIIDDDLRNFNYAISIGINIPDRVIDNINTPDGDKAYLDYYQRVNERLDEIALQIQDMIRKENHSSKAVKASYILPNDRLEGSLSHKFVANLAGLGWIGKSALLINPYYGPRIRWATILTDLELPVKNGRLSSRCAGCRLCVENCPSNAFKNVEFDEELPRSSRYDAYKCARHFDELEEEGRPRLCGLCVKVCPWGLVNRTSRTKEDII